MSPTAVPILYQERYANRRAVTFDIANHAAWGKKKSRETECIWMNFNLAPT
jgi:hypothetical protein